MATDALKLEAQAVLDELMQEGQLPFKLEARKIISLDSSQYTIHFYDSRLRSLTVKLDAGQSFRETFRAGVLTKVSKLSGPLNKKKS